LSISTLFSIISVGYLFINVLPVRLGELVRAYLAGQLLQTGTPRALSTVILERVLDVLTVVLLLLSLSPFLPLPAWAVQGSLLAGGVGVVLIVVMVFVASNREHGVRLGDRLGRWLPERLQRPFTTGWASLLEGFGVVKEPRQLALVALLSIAVWLVSAGVNYSVMVAFTLPAPPTTAVFVLCVTALSMVIPSSPGYIGVVEYMAILALSIFGIARESALSYGLVLHAVNYVGLNLLGLVGLWKESLSYSDLRARLQTDGGESSALTEQAAGNEEL
jgi:uncharacterized protein (TIRG00374 family)